MSGPWESSDVPRGDAYDRRFAALAASGMDMHGEADLVDSLTPVAASVLDAGCGTGRVAIELHRRGHAVVGVDVDGAMLGAARTKAPQLTWVHGDLADPGLDLGGQEFDIVVMAGNVLIFVSPRTEGRVIDNASRWLRPGGLLVTGYSLRPDGFGPSEHDTLAASSGLVLLDRWSTWDRRAYTAGDRYAVAVHRREI